LGQSSTARVLPTVILGGAVAEADKHSALVKGKQTISPCGTSLTLYLESSTTKPKTGDVNMDELVGNTEGFADSG
jgi:hypothetical protein